jgi:hypothetical protein
MLVAVAVQEQVKEQPQVLVGLALVEMVNLGQVVLLQKELPVLAAVVVAAIIQVLQWLQKVVLVLLFLNLMHKHGN